MKKSLALCLLLTACLSSAEEGLDHYFDAYPLPEETFWTISYDEKASAQEKDGIMTPSGFVIIPDVLSTYECDEAGEEGELRLMKEAVAPQPIPDSGNSIQDFYDPYNNLRNRGPQPPPPSYLPPETPDTLDELPPQTERPASLQLQQWPADEEPFLEDSTTTEGDAPEEIAAAQETTNSPTEPTAPPETFPAHDSMITDDLQFDSDHESVTYMEPWKLETFEETPPSLPAARRQERLLVKQFKVRPTKIFAKDYLESLIASYAGQELTLNEINDVAYVISTAYCRCGYLLARAYIPEQEITDGVVEIAVVEPVIDSVLIEQCGSVRLCNKAVRYFLDESCANKYVNNQGLEETLIILNDLPGVTARMQLQPGKDLGSSTLRVFVAEDPLITGSAQVNNYGNHYTGYYQVGARVNVNDLTGYGDQLSAQAYYTGRFLQNGRLAYVLPVSSIGTKVGLAASYMVYNLGGAFTTITTTGRAAIYSGFVTSPIYLSEKFSLYDFFDLDFRRITDEVIGGRVKKSMEILEEGVNGNFADPWGGLNDFSLGLSLGNLNASGVGILLDPYIKNSLGFFVKGRVGYSRLQCLPGPWSIYTSLAGQLPSRHLDGSEQMYLGGPYGIRAYPTGEAPSDFALLGTLEGRYTICTSLWFDRCVLKGFIDAGTGTYYDPPSNLGFTGNRNLAGIGVGLTLSKLSVGLFDIAYSRKIAGSAAQSNGKHSVQQLWVKVEAEF